MKKLKIYLIATIFGFFLMASCDKEDDTTTVPTVSDQQTAEQFAWAVKSSVMSVAPNNKTQTWANTNVSGNTSGSATVNGSFTYDYDAYSGRKHEIYNYVVIQFDKYCDDSYYPNLTGTIIIDGTCTTLYGWTTTYSGQWNLLGEDIQLSGKFSGKASIAMMLKRGGLDWAAIVETADGTWNISN